MTSTPEYQETQFTVLSGLAERIRAGMTELEHMYQQHSVGAVAWATRNLLELLVWVLYCKKDPTNAEEFYKDSYRDLLDIYKKLPDSYSRDPNSFSFAKEHKNLIEVAQKNQIYNVEGRFTDIRVVAKELGLDDYSIHYMMLSKFAHPTALEIFAPRAEEDDKYFKKMFYDNGLRYGHTALLEIGDVLRKQPFK